MIKVSVIIPAYNPNLNRLARTLDALKAQTLNLNDWELIIIDNNSSNNFFNHIDLSWHPQHTLISEPRQGLTYARLKGFENSSADLIVMVDDDNILNNDYLQQIVDIFRKHTHMGAAGGKSLPVFETVPPAWLSQFYGSLALRDLGHDELIESWTNQYPHCAPIGAGMAIRKTALTSYLQKVKSGETVAADRSGSSLASAGDNEIVLEIVKSGWQVGYFPQLILQHIIPETRMQKAYLARLERQTNCSWVQLLRCYQICPWRNVTPLSLPFRKIKAYFKNRAWKNEIHYIKWQGACGMFEGLTK